MKTLSALAVVIVSFALIHAADAQVVTYYYAPAPVVNVAPTTTYYAPAPTTTYYAPAPTTTYYAPAAPVTTYYAPAVPVATYYAPVVRPGLFGWRWRRSLRTWATPVVTPY